MVHRYREQVSAAPQLNFQATCRTRDIFLYVSTIVVLTYRVPALGANLAWNAHPDGGNGLTAPACLATIQSLLLAASALTSCSYVNWTSKQLACGR